MTKTFTENDLVRFLYGELEDEAEQEFQKALVTDDDLQRRLNDLRSVINDLDQVKASPSKRTIDRILNFSKGYHKESV